MRPITAEEIEALSVIVARAPVNLPEHLFVKELFDRLHRVATVMSGGQGNPPDSEAHRGPSEGLRKPDPA